LLKKIFSYGFVEGFAKGLNKLTLLALPLLLSTTDYGKIGLLVAIELMIPVITLLGFERAILRFYANEKDYTGFKKTIFSSVLYVHIAFLVLVGAIYLLGFKSFSGLDVFPDVFFIILLIYFQGTNLLHLNMLRVSEDHNRYFKARIIIQILRVGLILLCVYVTDSYLGYIIGAIIAALISNVFFSANAKSKEIDKEVFDKKTFKTLFAFSWPFIFHGVAGSLLGNADKFILENYLSLSEVGLYTLAYSIGSMMIFAYVGISVFMEPMIYKQTDVEKRDLLLYKYLFMAIGMGTVAFFAISLSSIYLMPYFYDAKYNEVIKYIPFIAMSFLIYPFYLKSNYKMIFEKKTLNIAMISVISSIVNIGLNFYFIPKYGIYAAVFTTLGSYVIQAMMFVLMSNKFKINKDFFEVLSVGLILSSCFYFKLEYYYVSIGIVLFLLYLYFSYIKKIVK